MFANNRYIRISMALFGAAAVLLGADSKPRPASVEPSGSARIDVAVRDFLLRNPEVIREALDRLRILDEKAAGERVMVALVRERESLMNDPEGQFFGNPKADVTVVEFFDYRCGYCKQMADPLRRLVEGDTGVRVLLKELPVLGPQSEFAAKAALASRSTGKYVDLHRALLSAQDLSEESVRAVAAQVGIGEETLAQAESPKIVEALRSTQALAERLGIQGTPGLIIGDRVLPGAVSYETLVELVAAERSKAPTVRTAKTR